MLSHLGFGNLGKKLEMALDITGQYEKKLVMTGRDTGATGAEFCKYILDTMTDPKLEERWNKYARA
jgi:isocitrate dehydrogenase (NAD+)